MCYTAIKHILTTLIFTAVALAQHVDPNYLKAQDQTINFYSNFFDSLEAIANGASEKPIALSKRSIHYLAGVNIYCVLKNGVCPFLLDSILEVDIAYSQFKSKASCPNMVRFWRDWIDNGLEKRTDYTLSTGLLKKRLDFKTKGRSKYLKCTPTVASEIKQGVSFKDFIHQRYAERSEKRRLIEKTTAYLKAIREKVPDVFLAVGAYKY